MIPLNFYQNRPYLDNEFTHPHFDPSTGMDPTTLAEALQKIYVEKVDNTPMATLRAEMFAFLYDNVQIEINPKNLFAAKINHRKLLLKYTNGSKARVLKKYAPETLELQKLCVEWGCVPCIDYHHTLPNWNDIQGLGFTGLLKRAEDRKAELMADSSTTEEQMLFIDSVITVYSAVLRLLTRIRDESLKYPEAAMFSSCMSELLLHEPRTVYESMMVTDLFMTIYEVGHENSRSFGLIDRIYEPFYLADLEAGRYTEEDLRELLRYLLNKYSAANRWAGQPLVLAVPTRTETTILP